MADRERRDLTSDDQPTDHKPGRAGRQSRADLDKVFGDVLPDSTRDERGSEWGEREADSGRDDDLRRDVPPHHG